MAQVAGWGVPHFGLYWATIREQFPHFQVVPEAEPEIEDFASGPPVPAQILRVHFEHDPSAVRCWFLTEDRTQLIQVQRNRLIQNWRKVTGGESYPRYELLRPAFEQRYGGYMAFLEEQGLGTPEVLQVEVTYINDIEPGDGWASAGDLHRLFTPWRGEFTESFLPAPYGARISASFALPEHRGQFHVNVQRAVRPRDHKEILQFRLTARVRPAGPGLLGLFEGIDLGRDWIVRGFADWTTPEMHKIWGRIE